MTRVALVESLKKLVEEAVKDMELPVAVQKGDEETAVRTPEIYRMRLPDSSSAKKLAPYVIIQLIDSKQLFEAAPKPKYTATVRFICCVYSKDESLGAISLLNLLDRIQIHLLRQLNIGGCFMLDMHEPFEALVYPDDTAPYYAGELVGTFQLPPIQQEVNLDG